MASKYRCKLAGYPDSSFQESFGSDEEESAIMWFEAFRHEFADTKNMNIDESAIVIVESKDRTSPEGIPLKTRVVLKSTLRFYSTKVESLGHFRDVNPSST